MEGVSWRESHGGSHTTGYHTTGYHVHTGSKYIQAQTEDQDSTYLEIS